MIKLFADVFIPPNLLPVLFGVGLGERYGSFSSKHTYMNESSGRAIIVFDSCSFHACGRT